MSLIKKIKLSNLFSFGPEAHEIELGELNVLIGPNGSGKSNLIDAVDLLRSAPDRLEKAIRDAGGISDVMWKGAARHDVIALDVVLGAPAAATYPIRYLLKLGRGEGISSFQISDEKLESAEKLKAEHPDPYLFYAYQGGNPVLNVLDPAIGQRKLRRETLQLDASILSQIRDPEHYPELSRVAQQFSGICVYREWSFGRFTPARLPQKADLPNRYLAADAGNLGLVLSRLRRDAPTRKRIVDALKALYDGVEDFEVSTEGGSVQVFFTEGDYTIPATRLSDGTFRYLCLLAILCDPAPPPLICIEEPELGLHPDAIRALAKQLVDASKRTQLIVTTHSEILVDAMSDTPESVLVFEKKNAQTSVNRLSKNELQPWLEKYGLGELWNRGDIGGNRW